MILFSIIVLGLERILSSFGDTNPDATRSGHVNEIISRCQGYQAVSVIADVNNDRRVC